MSDRDVEALAEQYAEAQVCSRQTHPRAFRYQLKEAYLAGAADTSHPRGSSMSDRDVEALAEALTQLEGHPRWEFVIEEPYHAARRLLTSGTVIGVLTLADDEDLHRAMAAKIAPEPGVEQVIQIEHARRYCRALVDALADRPSPDLRWLR